MRTLSVPLLIGTFGPRPYVSTVLIRYTLCIVKRLPSKDRRQCSRTRGRMKIYQGCPIFRHSLAVVLVTLMAMPVLGAERPHACFRSHLREAIEMNRERRGQYASITDSRSVPVSNTLIFLEQLALVSTRLTNDFDQADEVYQRAGFHVLCEDFVPMSATPAFKARFETGAPLVSAFRELDTNSMKARLKDALAKEGFDGVRKEAELWIASISREPRMNCLMRHTLDSIVRVATLAPTHAAMARARGLPSPERLERRLIASHWTLLGQIQSLDRKASSLQATGVPIICNDVPSLAL